MTDLREYFMLVESTQKDIRAPKKSYAAILRTLLNTVCQQLVFRLPDYTSYSKIKKILLEQVDS